jgi:hypothetical protein
MKSDNIKSGQMPLKKNDRLTRDFLKFLGKTKSDNIKSGQMPLKKTIV